MNCQTARDAFPGLLKPPSAASVPTGVRAHLAGCPDCQREYDALAATASALDSLPTLPPSPRLRENFLAMLEAEKQAATRGPAAAAPAPAASSRWGSRWRWLLPPALGGALLLAGFLLGSRFGAFPPPATSGPNDATRQELVALRRQVNQMSQLVGYSLLQQQQGPVSERLRHVLASANAAEPSNQVLDDLISALAFDPSANVRLRALEALYAHADNAVVRSGVVAALPREQNPLVQLELIDFVASAHDRNATPALEKMSDSETIDRSVRDAARRALAQL